MAKDSKQVAADKKADKKVKEDVKKDKLVNPVKQGSQERARAESTRPVPKHIDLSKEGKDFRTIVRVCNKDIPGFMPVNRGLELIHGIDRRLAKVILNVYNQETGNNFKKIGYLKDEDVVELEKIIADIDKKVPEWLLNRSKIREGGKAHLIMADLKLAIRKDLQRLGKIKSYRGLRLQWGLPVRGQKTKASFRKGGVVGVSKEKEKK